MTLKQIMPSSIEAGEKEYYFKLENLTITTDGKYCHSYGADNQYQLIYNTLPAWARTIEKINHILDQSIDPPALRRDFDALYLAAQDDYMRNDRQGTQTKLGANKIVNQNNKNNYKKFINQTLSEFARQR